MKPCTIQTPNGMKKLINYLFNSLKHLAKLTGASHNNKNAKRRIRNSFPDTPFLFIKLIASIEKQWRFSWLRGCEKRFLHTNII
jgi:hypothetical protein